MTKFSPEATFTVQIEHPLSKLEDELRLRLSTTTLAFLGKMSTDGSTEQLPVTHIAMRGTSRQGLPAESFEAIKMPVSGIWQVNSSLRRTGNDTTSQVFDTISYLVDPDVNDAPSRITAYSQSYFSATPGPKTGSSVKSTDVSLANGLLYSIVEVSGLLGAYDNPLENPGYHWELDGPDVVTRV